MPKVENFEDLFIWKEAKELVLEIYKHFKSNNDFSFRDQIQRSAVSVMNNIAEGFERSSDVDFKRFLFISKSSCGEVRSMLHLAVELNYIEADKQQLLLEKTKRLSSSIMNFIKYLNKT